jgi:hypothetical protein
MKLIGVIRPTETQELPVTATTYAEAKAELEGMIPDGWQLQSIREVE